VSLTDPLYVVAYDRRAFEDWCTRKGIDPNSRTVRYVNSVRVLNSLRHEVRILFLNGWGARKDWRAIHNRAHHRKATAMIRDIMWGILWAIGVLACLAALMDWMLP
jgi:hypothetical protein